ncbi:Lysophospholipase, alpha-beta hydrolase superfamily [Devosia enhydra]|uniref:Lysophospholipase, alpha-beta hydrolase superfamily n=1 Tax=Devosia enhydra TaxID=665118 RepID=A0A1K2I2T7_9HYPH|nr:alpha/beta hydrolase [Devosia enhydra]SFZ86559.1 Lysophospholipase, alpha-beta hydrolase superfamily [Devosia enhydra]
MPLSIATLPPLRQVATRDGAEIAYADYGGPATRGTAMLVHGLGAGALQFARDAEALAVEGYRVLVPDLRGHGASRSPSVPREAGHFAIPVMADDLLAVLADAGAGPVHWVGNSLGGILGLHLLAARPDVFASFAMFGTSPRLDLPVLAATGIPLLYRLLGQRLLAGTTAWGTTRAPEGRVVVARLLADFDPMVGEAIARNVRRYDLLGAALAHEGRMLILRGGRDRGVNRALDPCLRALQQKPRLSLVRLPEAGHCGNLDGPERFRAELLAFWQA